MSSLTMHSRLAEFVFSKIYASLFSKFDLRISKLLLKDSLLIYVSVAV